MSWQNELTQQRIKNEVEAIQQQLNGTYDDEFQQLDNIIKVRTIELFEDIQIVRVTFLGNSTSMYNDMPFYFNIYYANYPEKPPKIEFMKGLKHHQILQGTQIYCIPELNEKYWKRQQTLVGLINEIILSFHVPPLEAPYPVDLSVINIFQLEQKKGANDSKSPQNEYLEKMMTNSRQRFQKLQEEQNYYKEKQRKLQQ